MQLLESVIEEMCTVVSDVADTVMKMETVVAENPLSIHVLKGSVARAVKLANKAIGPASQENDEASEAAESSEGLKRSDSSSEEATGIAATTTTGTPHSSGSDGYVRSEPERGWNFHVAMLQPAAQAPWTTQSGVAGLAPLNSSFLDSACDYLPIDTSLVHLTSQPFADNAPALAGFPVWGGYPDTVPPTILDGFTLRLLRSALTTAYSIITGGAAYSSSSFARAFSRSIKLRSRESIIEGLQYVLGPGSAHMFRSSGATWKNKCELVKFLGLSDDGQGYLSTIEIQDHLMRQGARMLDSETMEVDWNLSGRQAPETLGLMDASPEQCTDLMASVSDSKDTTGTLDAPKPWAYIGGFFDENQGPQKPPKRPSKLKLQVSVLIAWLLEEAVCCTRGPIFPAQQLWAAIQASVIR